MALTAQDLIELTGAYEITNGDLVCFEGRHITLGRHNPDTGLFDLSAEGAEFMASLDATPEDVVDDPAPPAEADGDPDPVVGADADPEPEPVPEPVEADEDDELKSLLG